MRKKQLSYIDLTPVQSSKSTHISKARSFCPQLFLNQVDSLPERYQEESKQEQETDMPEEIIIPRTVRRRHAIGNNFSPQKSDQILPNLPHLSLHIRPEKNYIQDIFHQQEIQTTRQHTEVENISRKIKSIINSNRRQVSFQSSLVIVDEQDKVQITDLPTIRESAPRRRTHIKHLTTEV